MIIDQLPSIASVQETDEIPVEQGARTYKATLQKIKTIIASLLTKSDVGLGNVDNVRQYSAENPPIRYVDKSDISVSISANGGYQSLGTFTSLGVPTGATVVSFFIRGWNSANGAPVLLASTDGTTLYCMMSDAPSSVTISIRIFYAL